jgi:hypothetical protein
MTPAILRRIIGSAIEGLPFGREPHRHRPAAATRGGLHEGHVNAVYIGAFFAIHFDGDEIAIQQIRNPLVLKGLALHHVAPVASRITDRKEDRLVFAPRGFKRFRTPCVPVHGIARVLQQVGTLLVRQTIGVHAGWAAFMVAGAMIEP